MDWVEPEGEAEEGRTRRKKKPWRYRWPDVTRDEVLARLLELNAKRAREEAAAALTGVSKRPTEGARGGGRGQGDLF